MDALTWLFIALGLTCAYVGLHALRDHNQEKRIAQREAAELDRIIYGRGKY